MEPHFFERYRRLQRFPTFQRDKNILNLNEAFPEDFLQGFETIGRLKTFPGSPQFQTNRMHKMPIMHSVE